MSSQSLANSSVWTLLLLVLLLTYLYQAQQWYSASLLVRTVQSGKPEGPDYHCSGPALQLSELSKDRRRSSQMFQVWYVSRDLEERDERDCQPVSVKRQIVV